MALFSLTLDAATEKSLACLPGIRQSCAIMAAALEDMRDDVRDIRYCLGRPGTPRIVFLSETKEGVGMAKKILFKVVLATELDPTTVQRELSVQVDDNLADVRIAGVDVLEQDGFEAADGAAVHVEQVDIDDVGNRSKAAVLDATVADTFPPQQPGLPGILATGEVNE